MIPVLGTDNFVSQDYEGYRNDDSDNDTDSTSDSVIELDSDLELYG